MDAQAFADEAHGAITLGEMEDIHRRAREAGKLAVLVRNPSSSNGTGKPGKLAIYLDWKRKQVKEHEEAFGDFTVAAAERDVTDLDGYLKSVVGTDLEAATTAQLRTAAKTLREKAAA